MSFSEMFCVALAGRPIVVRMRSISAGSRPVSSAASARVQRPSSEGKISSR